MALFKIEGQALCRPRLSFGCYEQERTASMSKQSRRKSFYFPTRPGMFPVKQGHGRRHPLFPRRPRRCLTPLHIQDGDRKWLQDMSKAVRPGLDGQPSWIVCLVVHSATYGQLQFCQFCVFTWKIIACSVPPKATNIKAEALADALSQAPIAVLPGRCFSMSQPLNLCLQA